MTGPFLEPSRVMAQTYKSKTVNIIWDDFSLPGNVFTNQPLRSADIPNCMSITIQHSLTIPLVNIIPVYLRDASSGSRKGGGNTPGEGLELWPGQSISFELDDNEILSRAWFRPTLFFVSFNAVGILAATARLHIGYGVYA